jgi:hypothetical protein
MTRRCATLLVVALWSAVVHADVTIVQRTTMEGGMMALAAGGAPSPTMTIKIKGLKVRTDVDTSARTPTQVSTIADLTAKQVILLMHDPKIAQVISAGATPQALTAAPSIKVDASVSPTGRSQVIDGFTCAEHAFTSSISMTDVAANAPPEMVAMMKDLVMKVQGSMWVTKDPPGAAEYRALQKAMVESQLGSSALGATGLSMPGMDTLLKAFTDVDGIAYLTEASMTVEGTGQMADMMRKMGAMKVTTRVTSMKADPLSDDLFRIPADYTRK